MYISKSFQFRGNWSKNNCAYIRKYYVYQFVLINNMNDAYMYYFEQELPQYKLLIILILFFQHVTKFIVRLYPATLQRIQRGIEVKQ